MLDNMEGKILSSDWVVESTADLNKFGTRVQITNGATQSECELAPAWQWGDLSRGQVRLLTTARQVKTLIKKTGSLRRVSYVTYQSL